MSKDHLQKSVPNKKRGRRCRVRGKLGGAAFTRMLRWFGYQDGNFAHPACMTRVQRERRALKANCLCEYISLGAATLDAAFNGIGGPLPKILHPDCPIHHKNRSSRLAVSAARKTLDEE